MKNPHHSEAETNIRVVIRVLDIRHHALVVLLIVHLRARVSDDVHILGEEPRPVQSEERWECLW